VEAKGVALIALWHPATTQMPPADFGTHFSPPSCRTWCGIQPAQVLEL